MIDRRAALMAAGFCFLGAASSAAAEAFDRRSFDASLQAGGPIVVHVTAPWCPICRAQHPILEKLLAQPRFAGFKLYEIAFDTDKDSMRLVGARLQSTLIVFRDGREIAHTVGDREEGWIEELLEKALPKP